MLRDTTVFPPFLTNVAVPLLLENRIFVLIMNKQIALATKKIEKEKKFKQCKRKISEKWRTKQKQNEKLKVDCE